MHVSVVHERQIVLAQAAGCIRVYCTTNGHWSSPHTHCMHCIDDCTHILYETVQANAGGPEIPAVDQGGFWSRDETPLGIIDHMMTIMHYDD